MPNINSVYLLYHTRTEGDYENDKLLGVFSSTGEAQKAKEYALTQRGFRDYPDGFCITQYFINRREWTEGFGD